MLDIPNLTFILLMLKLAARGNKEKRFYGCEVGGVD